MRCFTCNNVLGHKCQVFRNFLKEKDDKQKKVMETEQMLNEIKVYRICCRRHLMTDIDIIEDNTSV